MAVVVATGAWFAGGMLSPSQQDIPPASAAPRTATPLTVELTSVDAEPVTETLRLQGHTAPNRQVTVRAETAGRVTALLVERGERVTQEQAIVRLATEDREAQRRKAIALVTQRERDHAAIHQLADAGHLAGARVDEAFAELESARAELARIEQDIDKTIVRAPFDGILNARSIEVGDFVAVRDPVFTVVDDHPLIVSAAIAQRDRDAIRAGDTSTVRLITGETISGAVRYLSAVANPETRTFPIEIEIENPGGRLVTGISAEAIVPARTTLAHRLSPGWLVRTGDDRLGVYLVDRQMHAQFEVVEIVRATPDDVWVTGLPASVNVVSSGQGFLRDGDSVRVTPADVAAIGSAAVGARR